MNIVYRKYNEPYFVFYVGKDEAVYTIRYMTDGQVRVIQVSPDANGVISMNIPIRLINNSTVYELLKDGTRIVSGSVVHSEESINFYSLVKRVLYLEAVVKQLHKDVETIKTTNNP
jgi:Mg2+/Co2+ transporter CorB